MLTPDGRPLLVSGSFANRITAFDLATDGSLGDQRVWAAGVAPDGICVDADGGVWCGAPDIAMLGGEPDAPGGALLRVGRDGGVTDRVELDQPAFSCVLGGTGGRTLFALTTAWRGFDRIDPTAAERTVRVRAMEVAIPGGLTGSREGDPDFPAVDEAGASGRARNAAGTRIERVGLRVEPRIHDRRRVRDLRS